MYKGTLSSGVEIAVASLVETSANCWCSNLELQYRKKVLNKRKLENDMPVSCGLTEQALIVLMLMFSDQNIIKSEPQEFCQPYWVLRGRRTFH